jgi:hypothetical protein
VTRCVAIAVAICVAATAAWGHAFPPVRTIVVQIERDELVLLVGYRPGSGDATETIIARAASQPKPRALEVLRDTMEAYALAPIAVTVDGKLLAPASAHAKLDLSANSVVVLVTYKLPASGQLSVISHDPRSTRISWQDRDSCRVDLASAPAQDRWFTGVASFLLDLRRPCATSRSSRSGSGS